MIKLKESHLILLIIIVALISYLISSYYLNCDVNCRINYYKYDNHYKKSQPVISKKDELSTRITDIQSADLNRITNEERLLYDAYHRTHYNKENY